MVIEMGRGEEGETGSVVVGCGVSDLCVYMSVSVCVCLPVCKGVWMGGGASLCLLFLTTCHWWGAKEKLQLEAVIGPLNLSASLYHPSLLLPQSLSLSLILSLSLSLFLSPCVWCGCRVCESWGSQRACAPYRNPRGRLLRRFISERHRQTHWGAGSPPPRHRRDRRSLSRSDRPIAGHRSPSLHPQFSLSLSFCVSHSPLPPPPPPPPFALSLSLRFSFLCVQSVHPLLLFLLLHLLLLLLLTPFGPKRKRKPSPWRDAERMKLWHADRPQENKSTTVSTAVLSPLTQA